MWHRNGPLGSPDASSQRPQPRSETFAPSKTSPEMSASMFSPSTRHASDPANETHKPSLLPRASDPQIMALGASQMSTIVIRKLPRSISDDSLNMLLFAEDLVGAEVITSPNPEDCHFTTAVAHFRTELAAHEMRKKLNGKIMQGANMIVELHSSGTISALERRATFDASSSQRHNGSTSSNGSHTTLPRPSGGRPRFENAFQSPEQVSPPLPVPNGSGHDVFSSNIQNLFSPRSPHANGGYNDRNRVSGKHFINGDGADEETRELLSDPLGYAKSSQDDPALSRFSELSISTNDARHSDDQYAMYSSAYGGLPRGNVALQSPLSPTNITNMHSNGYYVNTHRDMPPVNPADQHPPCNTLYVGNLPIDVSEDELKLLFSKQRGYRRLVLRTKGNGPMCFVEFEDVSFATKTLHELYGHVLSNSVKGGIRLSFSKNPLGVRSGQANGSSTNGHYAPHMAYSSGAVNAQAYSAAGGPPPGLSPPGLMNDSRNGFRAPHSLLGMGVDPYFTDPFGLRMANGQSKGQAQSNGDTAWARSANGNASPTDAHSGMNGSLSMHGYSNSNGQGFTNGLSIGGQGFTNGHSITNGHSNANGGYPSQNSTILRNQQHSQYGQNGHSQRTQPQTSQYDMGQYGRNGQGGYDDYMLGR